MINKSDICVIIGCYPQNNIHSALVSLTLESFKRQGYDTCIVSHSPLNTDIQSSCNYFIYSDENYELKFPKPSVVGFFFGNDKIFYKTNKGNQLGYHSYSILMNIKNALWLLVNKNYKKFIYVESDVFLSENDQKVLENLMIESDFTNKDFLFMIESYSENYLIPSTSIFCGDVKYFIDKLSTINSTDDYLESCNNVGGYSLEALFNFLFLRNEHNGAINRNRPLDLFESNWVGISTLGDAEIPGLGSNFNVSMDIVKLERTDGIKTVAFVIEENSRQEDVLIKMYKNNNLIEEVNFKTGGYFWWKYDTYSDEENWKIIVLYKNKIVNQLERTTKEIFWNDQSFLKIY